MKGFKSIEELSLKSCYNFLSSEENKNHPLYSAITERYNEMLQDLEKQDASDYAACKNIENYNAYVRKFSDNSIAPYYKAKHINEAKLAIEDLFWNSHKKSAGGCKEYLNKYPRGKYASIANSKIGSSKKTKWLVLGIVLIVVVIAFFIGYKPVNSLSVSEACLSFSKWGGTENVHISTNVSSNAVDVHCSEAGFDTEDDYGFDIKVSAEPNKGDFRTGTVKVTAYATLYGMRMGDGKNVTTNLSQESGLASRPIDITETEIHFEKYSSDIRTVYATTDGMNLMVSTEGIDNDWVNVSHDISREGDNNRAKIVISSHNNEGGERHGAVIISSDSFERRISLSQKSGLATYFNVSPDNLDIREEGNGEGRHYPVKVETDGTTWSVKDKPAWDGLNAEVRLSSGLLSVTVGPNPGRIRTGTITLVSNNGDLRDISIKQWGDPTNLRASQSSIKFGTSSDYDYVSISNDSKKSLSTSISSGDSGWLSASANGKNQVRISCSSNNNSPRSGTVYIDCGDERTSITVKQDGW